MAITKVSTSLVDLDNGVVINESSADADFRVESNNNANMLFVDGGNDRVGIGTSSPADTLHVALDSGTTNAEVEVVRIEATSSGTPAVGFGPFIDFRGDRINGGADSYGRLGFEADNMPSTTVDGAFIVQTAIDGSYSERLRIPSTGGVRIGDSVGTGYGLTVDIGTQYGAIIQTTESTPSANPAFWVRVDDDGSVGELFRVQNNGLVRAKNGIYFGTDSAAANALDDYEEGAFTPSLANTGVSPDPTGYGYYTKIGGLVHVQMYFNGISPASAGNTRINGMPFAASTPGAAYAVCHYCHGTILSDNTNGGGYFTGTAIDVIATNSTGYNSWAVGSSKYGMWSGTYHTNS